MCVIRIGIYLSYKHLPTYGNIYIHINAIYFLPFHWLRKEEKNHYLYHSSIINRSFFISQYQSLVILNLHVEAQHKNQQSAHSHVATTTISLETPPHHHQSSTQTPPL